MSANGDAAAEVTDKMSTATLQNADAAQRSRAAGWVEPVKYDYESYNADGKEARESLDPTVELPTWAANATKYEWKDEYGDVGPEHPELEAILFGTDTRVTEGKFREKLQVIPVTFESEAKIRPITKFEDAGLHPVMMKNIELCGYQLPTPIQAYCLPSILTGHDVIAVAQTGKHPQRALRLAQPSNGATFFSGSGKTAAFLVPILSQLMGKAKKLAAPRPFFAGNVGFDPVRDGVRAEPLVLVIAPTRELAVQIFDEARRLCYRTMLRPCVVYGGAPAREQMDDLRKGCDILIGTPGRLIDFIDRGHLLSLLRVKYTIIDEADEMVSADWTEDLGKIITGGGNDHTFMMFSATFPKDARALAKEYMAMDHIRIRVGRAGSTHVNVEQTKRDALFDLLLSMPPSRTIVFVNNKKAADFLDDYLFNKGLPSTSIHSDRTQREREDALRAFKSGKAPILVATGVSARGLDVKHVMHVVNYDLPNTDHGGIQEYVHRIGRTARIGNTGLATSFFNEKNEDIAEDLVRVLLETKQPVPDFLEQWKPEDENLLDFNDDSDEEVAEEADATPGATDNAWGGGTSAAAAADPGATPANGDWAPVPQPEEAVAW
ncbi:MAG: hypothetical protein Q9195_000886 [Heterodermia aff. obscurata]